MSVVTEKDKSELREQLFSLLHPIFRECVDPENRRYQLGTPYEEGDRIYATDGRVLVACGLTPEISEAAQSARPEGRFPKAESVFLDAEKKPRGRDVCECPIPTPAELKACRVCKGSAETGECRRCNGEGDVECDLGHFHDCGSCHGYGFMPSVSNCYACEGTGKSDWHDHPVKLRPNLSISWKYANLLRKHGALLRLPENYVHGSAIYFEIPGTGVEGCLMPLRQET